MSINKIELLVLIFILCISAMLRLYAIDKVPPGLYQDETAIGYNAYTILQSGKDEYGVSFPVAFQSFGEYKLPLYIYATSVAMNFLGKNEFAVRFSSALSGIVTILFLYLLLKQLLRFSSKQQQEKLQFLPLLSAFLLAVSPWHLQFSRAGFEGNMALLFYIIGCFFALFSLRTKKAFYFFISTFFFVLTLYTYNAYRVFTPISYVVFLYFFFLQTKNKKIIVSGMLLFIVSLIPFLFFMLSNAGFIRFYQTSAFTEYENLSFYNKIILYPLVVIKNYLSFFSFGFLFNTGDSMGRHQMADFGLLPKWQIIFLCIGFFSLVQSKQKSLILFTLFLLCIAPLAGAVALPAPHALRSLLMIIPFVIIIAYGIISCISKNRMTKFFCFIFFTIVFYETCMYFHFYYFHYPVINIPDWGKGYKELVVEADKYKNMYDGIIVDEKLAFLPLYFKFYGTLKAPLIVQNTWKKPLLWKHKKVLYIYAVGYPNHPSPSTKIQRNLFLRNRNSDLYVQFYIL